MSATSLTLCNVCHETGRPNSPLLFLGSQESLLAHAQCIEHSVTPRINISDEQESMDAPPPRRRSISLSNNPAALAAAQKRINTAEQKEIPVSRALAFDDSADAKPKSKTPTCYHCEQPIKKTDERLEYEARTYTAGTNPQIRSSASVMLHAECFKPQIKQDRKGIGRQASSAKLTSVKATPPRPQLKRQNSVDYIRKIGSE